MPRKKQASPRELEENENLKKRLAETEETLEAIRKYMVDAFVINRSGGEQIVTLTNAHYLYRTMVESMNEGAITLTPDGTIFYCNPCFANMVAKEAEHLVGLQFRNLIIPEEQAAFEDMIAGTGSAGRRGEFRLQTSGEASLPVQLSVYELALEDVTGIAILATDITERLQAGEKIRALASELTLVEQEERHRISQVLHDDLQQRLFAIRAHLSMLREFNGSEPLSAETRQSIDQIQDWLTEAIDFTRNLSVNISPVVLQGDGLAEALIWLGSQMKEQHGLHVEVNATQGFRPYSEHTRVLLFQAVRELLFNIVKHAGVLQATVSLEEQNGRSRIIVSDSGRGFDAEQVMQDPQTAHGLLIIRDRLGLMGYGMEIDSQPGGGTRITIELPATEATGIQSPS